MEAKRKALIIADEETLASASLLAAQIRAAEGLPYGASVVPAAEFSETDLLAAEVFFLGCSRPSPESFRRIEGMLARANFAGRSCGVFSKSASALEYLSKILKASDVFVARARLGEGAWPRELVEGALRGGAKIERHQS
ncbi:MAG: hypothetical protein FWE09_03225 [Treponema sp.]|nr:hypothetical protein [Treponema sp.]